MGSRYFAMCVLVSFSLGAQNLMKEKIRVITSGKRSLYFQRGVFNHNGPNPSAKLGKVRQSFPNRDDQGGSYERIVFDFDGAGIPRIYSHLSPTQNKLYMDFFNTTIKPTLRFPKKAKYVKNANFIPDAEMLSLELKFKTSVSAEIFYLDSPGRLVVDIKENTSPRPIASK